MTQQRLIWAIAIWVIITLVNYYYTPYFILIFIWPILCLTLFFITILKFYEVIKERKHLTWQHVARVLLFPVLLVLTIFGTTVNLVIEKADWLIFENKRAEMVQQVKNRELNPNVSWNDWVCELPYEFPVISNGGNDIGIHRNKENNGTTVTFWIFRNFFDAPFYNHYLL